MLKNVISPIQAWLMSQGKCVGCGMPLSKVKTQKHEKGEKVICKCGRIFIRDPKTEKYRRALLSEA
ncbi:hypothetical protein KKB40_05920 [Patescibacteria group bacterium]|nr:hypothetical protein [Patescibacteria group bacterium]